MWSPPVMGIRNPGLLAPHVNDPPMNPPSLRILNFYHHVVDKVPCLDDLFLPLIDHCIPHILMGDFNTHSPTWSPSHASPSSWHPTLKEWLNGQGFLSTIPNSSITWRHPGPSHNSLLDFIFLNDTALAIPSHFPPPYPPNSPPPSPGRLTIFRKRLGATCFT